MAFIPLAELEPVEIRITLESILKVLDKMNLSYLEISKLTPHNNDWGIRYKMNESVSDDGDDGDDGNDEGSMDNDEQNKGNNKQNTSNNE